MITKVVYPIVIFYNIFAKLMNIKFCKNPKLKKIKDKLKKIRDVYP